MTPTTILTVFEHQRLIATDFAVRSDFVWLVNEALPVFTIGRKQGQWQLKVGHYMGIVMLPSGTLLEILPKPLTVKPQRHSLEAQVRQTRQWVQDMLSVLSVSGQRLPHQKNIGQLSAHLAPLAAPPSPATPPVYHWLITEFMQRLKRYQLPKRYQTQRRNDTRLQGKLVIKSQLRRNAHQPYKFACEVDLLSHDTLASRMIKSALHLLMPILDEWQLRAAERRFQQIRALDHHEIRRLPKIYQHATHQLAIQPLSQRQRHNAQQLVDIAYWLLKQSTLAAGHGLRPSLQRPSLRLCVLLDMNQAFEQWASLSIATQMQATDRNCEALYQAQRIWLSDVTGQTRLSMRPDLLLRYHRRPSRNDSRTDDTHSRGDSQESACLSNASDNAAAVSADSQTDVSSASTGYKQSRAQRAQGTAAMSGDDETINNHLETRYSHVIDIKWKPLTAAGAISSSDAYQLTSYAHAYQAEQVWLVYPVLGDDHAAVALEQHYLGSASGSASSPQAQTTLWLMPFNVLTGRLTTMAS